MPSTASAAIPLYPSSSHISLTCQRHTSSHTRWTRDLESAAYLTSLQCQLFLFRETAVLFKTHTFSSKVSSAGIHSFINVCADFDEQRRPI